MSDSIKVVGNRVASLDPADCLRRAEKLIAEANLLAPHPKPRGFIFKARTWDEYETWKKQQTNPRLW